MVVTEGYLQEVGTPATHRLLQLNKHANSDYALRYSAGASVRQRGGRSKEDIRSCALGVRRQTP